MTSLGQTTTTDEVLEGIHLGGSTALVTGASAGIGVETTRALAAHGAHVIMGVRDLDKGERAAAPIRDAGGSVELREVDLTDLGSIRSFTDAVAADHDAIRFLIANAGVMATPQRATKDGFEGQLGTNHIGHFLLVNRLLPLVAAAAPSRVVVLSSSGHRFSDVDLDDPNFERTEYDPWLAYGRSKTANALFALELDRRYAAQGVRAASVHPGAVPTELGRDLTTEAMEQLISRNTNTGETFWKSIEQGAATSVWACVADGDEIGGRFLEDCHVAEVSADPLKRAGVHAWAQDPATAAALWDASERWVGETFPAP